MCNIFYDTVRFRMQLAHQILMVMLNGAFRMKFASNFPHLQVLSIFLVFHMQFCLIRRAKNRSDFANDFNRIISRKVTISD